MLAAANCLAEMEGIPDSARPLVEAVRRNVKLEARLIDDLLDLTRISKDKLTLEPAVVDVHTIVREAVAICGNDLAPKELTWTRELQASEHHAWVDADRLRQVFCNLFVNGRKFTPAGGRIAIRSRTRGNLIDVSVTDTGVGVPPEVLPRLFQRFSQGVPAAPRSGGLGLGLAISRGIIDAHGGTISAYSQGPGAGSTFTVTLRTAPAPAEPASAPPPKTAAADRGALRILVVEDHDDSAEISDLGLPDRSGLELIRELRGRMHVPAIALSGYGTEIDKRKSLEAGFDAHLTKPVELDKLLETVAHVVGNRTSK